MVAYQLCSPNFGSEANNKVAGTDASKWTEMLDKMNDSLHQDKHKIDGVEMDLSGSTEEIQETTTNSYYGDDEDEESIEEETVEEGEDGYGAAPEAATTTIVTTTKIETTTPPPTVITTEPETEVPMTTTAEPELESTTTTMLDETTTTELIEPDNSVTATIPDVPTEKAPAKKTSSYKSFFEEEKIPVKHDESLHEVKEQIVSFKGREVDEYADEQIEKEALEAESLAKKYRRLENANIVESIEETVTTSDKPGDPGDLQNDLLDDYFENYDYNDEDHGGETPEDGSEYEEYEYPEEDKDGGSDYFLEHLPQAIANKQEFKLDSRVLQSNANLDIDSSSSPEDSSSSQETSEEFDIMPSSEATHGQTNTVNNQHNIDELQGRISSEK